MALLKKLSVVLVLSYNLVGCSTVQVPDFTAYVTLPAGGDGFGITTVSKKEIIVPQTEWEEMKKRGIVVLSGDWKILKQTIRQNCITNRCEQAIGAVDSLFYAIDDALKKVNQ
jgi:hypothetical protein